MPQNQRVTERNAVKSSGGLADALQEGHRATCNEPEYSPITQQQKRLDRQPDSDVFACSLMSHFILPLLPSNLSTKPCRFQDSGPVQGPLAGSTRGPPTQESCLHLPVRGRVCTYSNGRSYSLLKDQINRDPGPKAREQPVDFRSGTVLGVLGPLNISGLA